VTALVVGHRQVEPADAAEVPYRHGVGVANSADVVADGAPEGAVAIAQEHADATIRGEVPVVHHHQVYREEIASEAAHRQGVRVRADRVVDRSPERAIDVAQEHGDIVVAGEVGDGHVELADAAEVPNHHRGRLRADGVVHGGEKTE